jgi:hypothetical protein
LGTKILSGEEKLDKKLQEENMRQDQAPGGYLETFIIGGERRGSCDNRIPSPFTGGPGSRGSEVGGER